MAERRILKRIIAFGLGICLICTACFQGSSASVNAEEKQITQLTLSNLGISSNSYNSGVSGTYANGFADTMVSFYATSTGPWAPRIHFGSWGEGDRTGINILLFGAPNYPNEEIVVGNDGFDGDTSKKLEYTRTTVSANDFGLSSFLGQKLLYQIKTEYLALDADDTKNDIRFTLYINRKQATSIDIKDQTDKLGNYIYIGDGVHVLEDYKEVKLADVEAANYEKLTFSDFDVADGALNGVGDSVKDLGSTLDQTLFQAKMYFPKTDFGSFFWGGSDWNGLSVKTYGNGYLYLYVISSTGTYELVIDPALVSTSIFENENLEFAISTEFLEANQTTTKLKIGVWFDGVLYAGNYFTTGEVALSDLTRHIHGKSITAGLKGYSIKEQQSETPGEVIKLEDSAEKDYEAFTLSDFGIADGNLNVIGDTTINYGSTLDKTLFRAKLYIPKDAFGNLIWGGSGWYGYNITGGESTLHLTVVSTAGAYDFVIEQDKTEAVLFENESLDFAISTEFVELDTVAGTTKLKIGVWLDGVLYNGKYFTTEKVALSDLTRHLHGKNLLANIKGASMKTENLDKPVEILPTDFAEYTLADTKPVFAHNAVGNGDKDGVLPSESLDRVLYSVKIKFTDKSQQFHYGNDETDTTPLGAYGGLTLYSEGGESLYLAKLAGKLPDISPVEIDPMKAIGEETFMNEEFLLQITTEYVAKDAGVERDDLKLGLWFNGKLYNETYLYYLNMVSYLGVRTNTNENYAPTVWSYYEAIPGECATYPIWTFKNSKIEDGVRLLGWNWGEQCGDTLNQTKFIGKMRFTDTEQYVLLGSNVGDYHGLGFQMKQGNLSVIYYDDNDLTAMPLTMTASDFGITSLLNTDLDFELNVRKLEEREDRILVEVIPVINGKMCGNKSALFNVHKGSFVQNVCTINEVEVTSSDKVVLPPEKEDEVDFHKSYEKLTLRDYLLESITFSAGTLYRVYDNQPLDGTSFGAKIKFSKDNNGTTAFYLGGDMWYGIRVEAQTTGRLGISHIGTDGTQTWIASVDPQRVGLKTFLGKEFEMKMTFDFFGEKDGKVSAKIGLYINGKLYDGKYLTLRNVEKETMRRTLFIYGAGTGTVTITSIYKEVDFRIWGLTKNNWRRVLGLT